MHPDAEFLPFLVMLNFGIHITPEIMTEVCAGCDIAKPKPAISFFTDPVIRGAAGSWRLEAYLAIKKCENAACARIAEDEGLARLRNRGHEMITGRCYHVILTTSSVPSTTRWRQKLSPKRRLIPQLSVPRSSRHLLPQRTRKLCAVDSNVSGSARVLGHKKLMRLLRLSQDFELRAEGEEAQSYDLDLNKKVRYNYPGLAQYMFCLAIKADLLKLFTMEKGGQAYQKAITCDRKSLFICSHHRQ